MTYPRLYSATNFLKFSGRRTQGTDAHLMADLASQFPVFGLTLRKWHSGTADIDGMITKQGGDDVRVALGEAAFNMLLRAKNWAVLRAWELRTAKRSSTKNAVTIQMPISK